MTGIRGLVAATLKSGPMRPSMDPQFDAPGARADAPAAADRAVPLECKGEAIEKGGEGDRA